MLVRHTTTLLGASTFRVLARILDLGRVSNDQGVHMPITLNSKITVLVMLANNNACGCSTFCNQIHTLDSRVPNPGYQIQGEHIHSYCALTLNYSATLGGI